MTDHTDNLWYKDAVLEAARLATDTSFGAYQLATGFTSMPLIADLYHQLQTDKLLEWSRTYEESMLTSHKASSIVDFYNQLESEKLERWMRVQQEAMLRMPSLTDFYHQCEREMLERNSRLYKDAMLTQFSEHSVSDIYQQLSIGGLDQFSLLEKTRKELEVSSWADVAQRDYGLLFGAHANFDKALSALKAPFWVQELDSVELMRAAVAASSSYLAKHQGVGEKILGVSDTKTLSQLEVEEDAVQWKELWKRLSPHIKIYVLWVWNAIVIAGVVGVAVNLYTPQVEELLRGTSDLTTREINNKLKKIPSTCPEIDYSHHRFVSGDNVAVRHGPSVKTELIDELRQGTLIVVIDRKRGWSQVVYRDDVTGQDLDGWVFGRYTARFRNCRK